MAEFKFADEREKEDSKKQEGIADSEYSQLAKKAKEGMLTDDEKLRKKALYEEKVRRIIAEGEAERKKAFADEYNKADWGVKAGRFGFSMVAPVSSAYTEKQALNGEEPSNAGVIGAAAADIGLNAFLPLRAGIAGVRAAAPQMLPKIATGRLSNSTANKMAQGAISAADNVANSAITTAAENKAGDKDNDVFSGWSLIPASVGAYTGARKINRMVNAQGELAGSVPQDIRLNEKAGMLADNGNLNIGSTKNDNSIALAEKIFNNPNNSLDEAIVENALSKAKINTRKPEPKPSDSNLRIPESKPKSQKERNILKDVSDNIDSNRESIYKDMLSLGYLDEHGIMFNKLDNVRDYLNNIINWNKNEQGLARSAPQEKAAREIYSEINRMLDKGDANVVVPKKSGLKNISDEMLLHSVKKKKADVAHNVPEFEARRKWDKEYHDNLVEGDLVTGMQSKRATRSNVKKGTYYPTRGVDPSDIRNVYFGREYLPNIVSARVNKAINNIMAEEPKDPVEQYLFLAKKHGKDYGPAPEFLKTLTKEQREEAQARQLTGE
jgi:hypothetical protein